MGFHRELWEILFYHQTLALLVFTHLVFFIAVIKKNYAVVDIAWGLGFCLVALISFGQNRVQDERSTVVFLLVLFWGIRLASYLLLRLLKKKEEDFRYAQMRAQWGRRANVHAWIKIFLFQPVILWLIAAPMSLTLMRSTIPWNILDTIGLIIALSGLVIETLADAQMAAFKSKEENKGKLIRVGLWKHSRHPNYFGEMLFWWGLGFFALNSVLPWIAFNGAMVITFLLLKVSGAPLLEEKLKKHPDYEDYLKETNAFVPLQWRG